MSIAVHSSTPAYTLVNVANTAIQSASFSPPAGSLIVICVASSRFTTVSSISDSVGAALTNKTAYTQAHDAGSTTFFTQVWIADCASGQTGMTVTANLAGAVRACIGVIVLTGALAASSQSGASTTSTAGSGAPSLSTTTTANGSMVIASFCSRSQATAPTPGGGQTLSFNSQTFDAAITGTGSDHQWAQWTGSNTTTSGTSVTLSDSAPTTGGWAASIVELLADLTPPPADIAVNLIN